MLIMQKFIYRICGLTIFLRRILKLEIMYTKHLNFVEPDEGSRISSMSYCKRVGMNRNKGQWTVEEDGYIKT